MKILYKQLNLSFKIQNPSMLHYSFLYKSLSQMGFGNVHIVQRSPKQ